MTVRAGQERRAPDLRATTRHVTLSFDRVYFILIWLLVITKLVASRIFGVTILADVVMCTILGLMAGRLSGICLRVHSLRPREFST